MKKMLDPSPPHVNLQRFSGLPNENRDNLKACFEQALPYQKYLKPITNEKHNFSAPVEASDMCPVISAGWRFSAHETVTKKGRYSLTEQVFGTLFCTWKIASINQIYFKTETSIFGAIEVEKIEEKKKSSF